MLIQSGSADFLLATLADLLINPELTLDIIRLFRPLLLDLTHRCVIKTCLFQRILISQFRYVRDSLVGAPDITLHEKICAAFALIAQSAPQILGYA